MKVKILIKIGILAGLSFLLMLVQFPIFPQAPFLKCDFGNLPAVVASFALGPLEALIIVLLRDLIFFAFKAGPVELVGIPMNFLASSIFVLTSGFIYRIKKSKFIAVLSLVAATFVTTSIMIPANYFVYPLFVKFFLPQSNLGARELMNFILFVVTPFNFINAAANSILVFLVYKKFSFFLKKK